MVRLWCRALLSGALVFSASAVWAETLALVLTRAGGGSAFLHSELSAGYAEAGFTVMGGFDLDTAATTDLLGRFEAAADSATHLAIHLTGGLRDAGGLTVLLPAGAPDDSLTDLLTGGIPLPLFMSIAERHPGQSMLALGALPEGATVPAPQTVLVVEGGADAVATLVLTRMLEDGLPAARIDPPAGVRFGGLISDSLRLGRADTAATASGPTGAVPDAVETALALDLPTREGVQAGLSALGYYNGPQDGVFGAETRAALAAWQQARGLPPTGYLGAQGLSALLEAATSAALADAEAARERAAWDSARRLDTIDGLTSYLESYPDGRFAEDAQDRLESLRTTAEQAERVARYREEEQALGLTLASMATVEKRLRALGLNPGLADGQVEIDTRRAIARFQAQIGMTPTGYLSRVTLQRLVVAGP